MFKRRTLLRALGLALPMTTLVVAVPARADDAANTATARALGIDGVTLAEAGKCKEAIEKLERAESLHHAPTTATWLGECEIETGRLVVGTERLQRVVREPLAANAHPVFGAAVMRAQKVLNKALPRIATLRISVKVPRPVAFAVTIDDEPVPDAMVDSNRRIDPGIHRIKVTADGCLPSSATASLEEGQTKSMSLELHLDPAAPAERAGDVRVFAYVPPETASKAPPIAAFAVGALGLAAGTVAAITVERKSAALSTTCDANKVCPADSRADIREVKTWATISTIGFIAGGAGVATGLVLLLTSGRPPSSTPTGLRVRPSVGATSVGVDGTF